MSSDINELDVNDIGLKQIFGDRFHDETQHKPTAEEMKKEYNDAPKREQSPQKTILKPRDAEWEPEPHAPTQMEKLKACAKDALLFGGLSLMFFCFQQSGQMAMSASMPCICACCVLAGWGVGKNVR